MSTVRANAILDAAGGNTATINGSLPVNTTTLRTELGAAGAAPIYAARAWVNFCGVPSSGTYSRTGTLVTVTLTAHGMVTGQLVSLDFTTGTASDGSYAVTVTGVNTFTVTDTVSGSTSGNVTRQTWTRSSKNVDSVTDNGVGKYSIIFTEDAPNVNYCAISNVGSDGLAVAGTLVGWVGVYETTGCGISVSDNNTDTAADAFFVNAVFYW